MGAMASFRISREMTEQDTENSRTTRSKIIFFSMVKFIFIKSSLTAATLLKEHLIIKI